MATARDPSRVRITGHAYTLWIWGETPIAYATNVTHTSPQPLAQAVDIQPLNYVRPVEIATGRAITRGELSMTVVELYGYKPWQHLGSSFAGTLVQDLADVFHKMQREYTEWGSDPIRLARIIRPPGGGVYVEKYYNIRILDVREDENVTTDSLQNQLQVTVGYTHKRALDIANAGIGSQPPDPLNIPDPRIYP